MKKLVLLLSCWAFILSFVNAQVPQAIKYQAIARDVAGNLLVNQEIGLQISLLQGQDGPIAYQETHTIKTNDFGLINLAIGQGVVRSGEFATIDWSKGNYYIQLEMDSRGGEDYQIVGASELFSVPYALYSELPAVLTEPGPAMKEQMELTILLTEKLEVTAFFSAQVQVLMTMDQIIVMRQLGLEHLMQTLQDIITQQMVSVLYIEIQQDIITQQMEARLYIPIQQDIITQQMDTELYVRIQQEPGTQQMVCVLYFPIQQEIITQQLVSWLYIEIQQDIITQQMETWLCMTIQREIGTQQMDIAQISLTWKAQIILS